MRFAAVVLVLACVACDREFISEEKLEYVVDGRKVSDVTENRRKGRVRGELVQRRHILVDQPGDAVVVTVSLDDEGFALGGSYRREGRKGKRYVELKPGLIFSRGDDETVVLPTDKPIVLLETLHRLHALPRSPPNQGVLVVDLDNAVVRDGRIDEAGKLVMPTPLPAPLATDPVKPEHTQKAPFLESKTAAVTTWCRSQALGDPALTAAHKLALATKPKLAEDRAGGPPAALMAVQIGGWDDSGAALVVACLRALEHPARVVSGRVSGASVLRTWGQVHDGTAWVDVDPLDIDLEGKSALTHEPLVEGFRGPLTTGLLPR